MLKSELLAKAREAQREAEIHSGAPMRDTWEQLANIFYRLAALEPQAAGASDVTDASPPRSKRANRSKNQSSLRAHPRGLRAAQVHLPSSP
jgi:hypothetical protein